MLRIRSCNQHSDWLVLLLVMLAPIGGCGATQRRPQTAATPAAPPATTPSTSSSSTPTHRAAAAGVPNTDHGTGPLKNPASAEAALEAEVTLSEILRVALARNPELVEARERVRAAREVAPAASRLPDPEFEYQLWGQPIARP